MTDQQRQTLRNLQSWASTDATEHPNGLVAVTATSRNRREPFDIGTVILPNGELTHTFIVSDIT